MRFHCTILVKPLLRFHVHHSCEDTSEVPCAPLLECEDTSEIPLHHSCEDTSEIPCAPFLECKDTCEFKCTPFLECDDTSEIPLHHYCNVMTLLRFNVRYSWSVSTLNLFSFAVFLKYEDHNEGGTECHIHHIATWRAVFSIQPVRC